MGRWQAGLAEWEEQGNVLAARRKNKENRAASSGKKERKNKRNKEVKGRKKRIWKKIPSRKF
jgi:hypothetical protein